MFPIRDDNSDRTSFPVVSIVLIVINVLVFVLLQGMGHNDNFTYAWSTVPQEIVTGKDIVTADRVQEMRVDGQNYRVPVPGLKPTPVSVYLTLLTAMFMHGGWGHLLGNMWFLWIFGDNIEDDLGKGIYTLFYLVSGLLAAFAHIASTYVATGEDGSGMLVPCLGASGAISGVMGAYLVLHPKRQVTVVIFRFVTQVPGFVAVGMWFGMQILLSFVQRDGGVAYGAHIGGFIAGAVLVLPVLMVRGLKPADMGRPAVEERSWTEDNRRY